ncbi:MAG: DUF5107 domain-containing protein [Anaerolineae bacterium]
MSGWRAFFTFAFMFLVITLASSCRRTDTSPELLTATAISPNPTATAIAKAAAPSATPLLTAKASASSTVQPRTSGTLEKAASATLAPTTTASPVPLASSTPVPTITASPIPRASSTPVPTEIPLPSPTSPPAVTAAWGEITLRTYGYRQALYTDPAGIPYPLLHREQVTPPEPQVYRVLRISNGILELTFIPELGGRLYQCRFLPTGQDLFYNNTVIKPNNWGPVEQGWWLAIGGMEWCLPVDEHGYVSAEPWDTTVSHNPDGSASARMQITEKSRNIQVVVTVNLSPASSAFTIHTSLYNPNAEAKSLQYWINAMLSPGARSVGDGLRLVVPATHVVVHSVGENSLPGAHELLTWPLYQGRDLSYYRNWRNWLGFFAPELSANFTAIYDEQSELGIVRAFPADLARGAKLFAFGANFPDVGSYTDDGSKYIEMWGGLTPSFWDYATLAAGATESWEETWYVLAGCGTPVQANKQAALSVMRDGSMLQLGLATTLAGQWRIRILAGDEQILELAVTTSPDTAYLETVTLPATAGDKPLEVTVLDQLDQTVMRYKLP